MSGTSIISLAEYSCWNGNDFRAVRKKIWFTIHSIGKIDGKRRVAAEFQADFTLMYDADNSYTIWLLGEVEPDIRWDQMFFWRRFDLQAIDVYDAGTEKLFARIRVRGRGVGVVLGSKTSGESSDVRRESVLGIGKGLLIDFQVARERLRGGERSGED